MKLRVPRQVSVGGLTIKVARRDLTDIDCYGQYCDKSHRMVICSTLSDKDAWDTFTHELVHAVFDVSGVSHGFPGELEEPVVRCLDNLFFPVYLTIVVRQVKRQLLKELKAQPPKNGPDLHPDQAQQCADNHLPGAHKKGRNR